MSTKVSEKYAHAKGHRRTEKAEHVLDSLDSLSPLEYGRARKELAEELGVPLGYIDKEYEERRRKLSKTAASAPLFEPIEPWPHAIDGEELLDQLTERFDRYVYLPKGGATTCALWSLHTHSYDSFQVSPYLAITSPTPECGKTTLAAVIESVVANPIQASNISTAAVFRVVERYHPTLIIDEADTFLSANEELRGILNAGHNRQGAHVIRVEGDQHEPRRFSVWCPKVIAMIGKPGATLLSRSIPIALKRQTFAERKERLTSSACSNALARKCARWAVDNEVKLRSHQPKLPENLFNRTGDNWLPLITIADIAGGVWPEIARQLATEVAAKKHDDVASVMLLQAIRTIYAKTGADRLASEDIVNRLQRMEGSPWPEYRHGKPITPNHVANLLKDYGVQSRQIRFGAKTMKGYRREAFDDAFKRYLKP